MERPAPVLSVVVMGYRDEATILDAVGSVTGQVVPEPVEVVVVTSGGDGSAQAVRTAHPGMEVVASAERLLPGGARNVGVAASTGGIVAFLAADCTAEPGWVAARLAAHRAGHPVVAGAMTCAPPRTPAAWASHVALFGHRLPGRAAGVVAHPDPAAHGLSYERSVLERLGPFDPSLRIGEDTESARRLAELGIPVWFEPRVRTAHRGPRSGRALVADHYRRGVSAARAAGPDLRPLSLGGALVRYPVAVALASLATLRTAWRHGRGERPRLVVVVPWIVAARAAGLAGRYRERVRAGR